MANQTKQKQPQGREQYEQQQKGQGQQQQWPDQKNKKQSGKNRMKGVDQDQTPTWDQPESATRRNQEDGGMDDQAQSRSERRGVGATDVDDV
jgi:hypothetical protein